MIYQLRDITTKGAKAVWGGCVGKLYPDDNEATSKGFPKQEYMAENNRGLTKSEGAKINSPPHVLSKRQSTL